LKSILQISLIARFIQRAASCLGNHFSVLEQHISLLVSPYHDCELTDLLEHPDQDGRLLGCRLPNVVERDICNPSEVR